MKVKEIPISEITPYANNPRNNAAAVEPVAASIRDFGFRVPIVLDKNGVIVAGHTRLEAAKRLGLSKVPCVVADDLTAEQARAFRIADNKTAELATWDAAKLAEELADISDFDMGEFGFYLDAEQEAPTQNLNEGGEISSEQFSDEQFACTCPRCGFKFNPKE